MEFPSPETPKPLVIIEGEKAEALRKQFALSENEDIYLGDLGEGEKRYTTNPDGTYITLEDSYQKKIDALYNESEKGERRDLR